MRNYQISYTWNDIGKSYTMIHAANNKHEAYQAFYKSIANNKYLTIESVEVVSM